MLSRVADSLYWMSRYLERAEHRARVVGANLDLSLERGANFDAARWAPVLEALNCRLDLGSVDSLDALLGPALYEPKAFDSVRACIDSARENARQVREQISSEMWEELNRLYLRQRGRRTPDEDYSFCRQLIEGVHLFHGITDATLNHDEGWQFIRLGQAMERAVGTARLLNTYVRLLGVDVGRDNGEAGSARDYLDLVGLLKSCNAFEAYCKVHTADLSPLKIAEFLLLDAAFPHSIRFCVDRLNIDLQAIAEAARSPRTGQAERLAGRLSAQLDFAQIDEVVADDLQTFLRDVMQQCGTLHTAVYGTYIDYAVDSALSY